MQPRSILKKSATASTATPMSGIEMHHETQPVKLQPRSILKSTSSSSTTSSPATKPRGILKKTTPTAVIKANRTNTLESINLQQAKLNSILNSRFATPNQPSPDVFDKIELQKQQALERRKEEVLRRQLEGINLNRGNPSTPKQQENRGTPSTSQQSVSNEEAEIIESLAKLKRYIERRQLQTLRRGMRNLSLNSPVKEPVEDRIVEGRIVEDRVMLEALDLAGTGRKETVELKSFNYEGVRSMGGFMDHERQMQRNAWQGGQNSPEISDAEMGGMSN